MPPMPHALIRKLESFGPLPDGDKELIRSLTNSFKTVEAHTDIIREGEKPSDVNLILGGFAYRYKALPGGERQIVAYLMPGDFCDLHVFLLGEMDHSIATLSDVQLVKLPRRSVLDLLDRPAISRAMLMATLVDEATLREWLINIGQRSAEQRVAHFLCEWHRRLEAIGLVNEAGCELPLTQAELADTTGLSTVHANRTLRALREQGLLIFRRKRLVIPDVVRLREVCGFRQNYLHLANARLGEKLSG